MPINYMAGLGSAGTAAAGAPVLAGSSPYNYNPSFGGIPGVPAPAQSASNALGGNIGNLSQIYSLGQPLNQFTAQQAPASLNLNLPQYQSMIGQSSGNILSKLQGQVPQDVLNQIGQLAAERGVSTGSIGSPNANAAELRALGLTSLDLQNQGEQQLTAAIGRTPQGSQFNPYSFLVSPQEQQAAQYQANLLNAAPVPSSAAGAGLSALQSGRQAGYSGFPSSAPMDPTQLASNANAGLPAMGSTPYGPSTGSYNMTGYGSEQYGPPSPANPLLPGDFEAMYPDLAGQDFQTGYPASESPGWTGGDFSSNIDWGGGDLFGDGGFGG
jgi:hypothetical protein